jgi:hypothetical protein
MARMTPKGPEQGETQTPDEGVPRDRKPTIPKAKYLGGNSYRIPVSAPGSRRPIPKKHRKTTPR